MNIKMMGAAFAALAVGGLLTLAAPKPAEALPAYAASTGKACGACHVKVPTGVVSAMRSANHALVTCTSCGRYLYAA